jgi:hypothetical protein
MRWPRDAGSKSLDVCEVDPLLAGLVGEVDGGDFVAVLVEVGPPRLL